ncbi:MAG TPA: 2Fe-2S iron-sulfur cluster-binding protein, partial [Candidatus Binatia bacterium]
LGRQIPTICYHDHCTANGLCRVCVVEVNGVKPLVPSCLTPVREGIQVSATSPRAERSRRTILEMLASAVDLSQAPEIQKFLNDYRADPARFPEAERREHPVLDDNPMYIRDYSKCILCWRCVQVCAEDAQFTYAINFSGRGFETSIGTFYDKPMPETTCVFCGQCVGVCPTGALKPKREWLLEQGVSLDEIMQATKAGKKRRRKSP